MRKRLVFGVLVVLWMRVIFFYSHRPAEVSAQDSYEVGMMTGRVVIEDFEEWSFIDQLAFAMKVDHPIRKLAHFTEYFVLTMSQVDSCLHENPFGECPSLSMLCMRCEC